MTEKNGVPLSMSMPHKLHDARGMAGAFGFVGDAQGEAHHFRGTFSSGRSFVIGISPRSIFPAMPTSFK